MNRAAVFAVLLLSLAGTTSADEELAKRIGMPKNFDPEAAAWKAEGVKPPPKQLRKVQLARQQAAIQKPPIWQPVVPVDKPQQVVGAGRQPSMLDEKRLRRAMLARWKRQQIVANAAANDAGNSAAANADILWAMRRSGW
ncbi:MAG TPA: hypothetical protein VGG64_21080 [Pirellulales bacterium]